MNSRSVRLNEPCRAAFGLLELLVVITLLGIFAAVAIARLGPTMIANLESQADGRRLALDLLQAQRRAITTGKNHVIEFTMQGSNATGYTLCERNGAALTPVDAFQAFPSQVTVTPSASVAEFAFDGTALGAYQVTLTGPSHSWRVSVVPASGAIKVNQL